MGLIGLLSPSKCHGMAHSFRMITSIMPWYDPIELLPWECHGMAHSYRIITSIIPWYGPIELLPL